MKFTYTSTAVAAVLCLFALLAGTSQTYSQTLDVQLIESSDTDCSSNFICFDLQFSSNDGYQYVGDISFLLEYNFLALDLESIQAKGFTDDFEYPLIIDGETLGSINYFEAAGIDTLGPGAILYEIYQNLYIGEPAPDISNGWVDVATFCFTVLNQSQPYDFDFDFVTAFLPDAGDPVATSFQGLDGTFDDCVDDCDLGTFILRSLTVLSVSQSDIFFSGNEVVTWFNADTGEELASFTGTIEYAPSVIGSYYATVYDPETGCTQTSEPILVSQIMELRLEPSPDTDCDNNRLCMDLQVKSLDGVPYAGDITFVLGFNADALTFENYTPLGFTDEFDYPLIIDGEDLGSAQFFEEEMTDLSFDDQILYQVNQTLYIGQPAPDISDWVGVVTFCFEVENPFQDFQFSFSSTSAFLPVAVGNEASSITAQDFNATFDDLCEDLVFCDFDSFELVWVSLDFSTAAFSAENTDIVTDGDEIYQWFHVDTNEWFTADTDELVASYSSNESPFFVPVNLGAYYVTVYDPDTECSQTSELIYNQSVDVRLIESGVNCNENKICFDLQIQSPNGLRFVDNMDFTLKYSTAALQFDSYTPLGFTDDFEYPLIIDGVELGTTTFFDEELFEEATSNPIANQDRFLYRVQHTLYVGEPAPDISNAWIGVANFCFDVVDVSENFALGFDDVSLSRPTNIPVPNGTLEGFSGTFDQFCEDPCGNLGTFSLARQGSLWAINTDFELNGNELFTWYNADTGEQVAVFMGIPFYAPTVLGTYYVTIYDPDTDCTQNSDNRTITELNGCCELD